MNTGAIFCTRCYIYILGALPFFFCFFSLVQSSGPLVGLLLLLFQFIVADLHVFGLFLHFHNWLHSINFELVRWMGYIVLTSSYSLRFWKPKYWLRCWKPKKFRGQSKHSVPSMEGPTMLGTLVSSLIGANFSFLPHYLLLEGLVLDIFWGVLWGQHRLTHV